MFTGPQASIDNKFELPSIKFKKGCPQRSVVATNCYHVYYTWKAIEIDCSQELKEFDTVFRVLREVLIDHI